MSAQPDNKNDQSPNNQQTTPTETTTISTETQPHPTLQVSKVNHSNDELEEELSEEMILSDPPTDISFSAYEVMYKWLMNHTENPYPTADEITKFMEYGYSRKTVLKFFRYHRARLLRIFPWGVNPNAFPNTSGSKADFQC